MMHSRFSVKHTGFIKWRSQASRRRAKLRILVPIANMVLESGIAAKYHSVVPIVKACPASLGIRVGEFIVGEKGDRRLVGHPDIRY